MKPSFLKLFLEGSLACIALAIYLLFVLAGLEILGWLGMGMVGAAALGISYRADLFQDYGNVHSDDALRSAMLKPRFEQAQAMLSPMERMKARVARTRARRWLRAANTIFAAITLIGFGMFVWGIRADLMA